MSESQIETLKANSVIALTKFIMHKFDLPQDEAFSRLCKTDFFTLLNDTGTNLFMETNDYLCKACELELDVNSQNMYEFIQNN